MSSRRQFLGQLTAGIGGAALAPIVESCRRSAQSVIAPEHGSPWEMVPSILARIRPPSFPDRDFSVTDYGAAGDGITDCTRAFREAIDSCSRAGGGRVVVPEGRFLTGAIHLRSNVNLHIAKEATVVFSRDPKAYLPAVLTRFEGTELMNYSPFVYAFDRENIAITGEGTLDGQASEEHWWPWKGSQAAGWKPGMPNYNSARRRLLDMAERGIPVAERVFGEGDYLRPNFIQPYRCRNVLIEGVTIVASPMWEVHPVLCTNVTVRRLTIVSHGPNNDGCDPESCRDVVIEDCLFDTGDDCIAIKSGRNADGRRLHAPAEYIVVRGCHMRDGHGGVTIGSEISGDCRWVFAERNRMDSPRLRFAVRLKNNAARGGVLEHIYMRDCPVGEVANAVVSIDFNYEEGPNGAFRPVVRDVRIERVTSRKSEYALYLRGLADAPIADVRLADCTFGGVARANVVEHVEGLVVQNVRIGGS